MERTVADKKPVVLIVEDEPFIRMNVVELVEEAGFEAIEAADATKLFASSKVEKTFAPFSRISRCRDRWTASNWRGQYEIVGRR
jgi:hypothetical protein